MRFDPSFRKRSPADYLLLGRAAAKRHESAVRVTLGSSSGMPPRLAHRAGASRRFEAKCERAKAEAVTRFKVLREMTFDPEADGAAEMLTKLSGGFFKFYKGFELDDGHAGVRGVDRTLRGRRRAYFLECRVGQAHPGAGPQHSAGSRRLVLKVDSLQIKRMYFTTEHYDSDSWWQLVL